MANLSLGDPVVWHYQSTRSYGYVVHIPAKICGFTAKRISLIVAPADAPHKQKIVIVRPDRVTSAAAAKCATCGRTVKRG